VSRQISFGAGVSDTGMVKASSGHVERCNQGLGARVLLRTSSMAQSGKILPHRLRAQRR
jgi:hypothetical protein